MTSSLVVMKVFCLLLIIPAYAALPPQASWTDDIHEASRLDLLARYTEAQSIYDRVIKETSGVALPDSVHGELINDLAAHYHRLAQYGEAERLYQQAIGIWRGSDGVDAQRDLALSIGNLAALYRLEGRFPDAERLYREELDILQRVSGKETANFVIALNNIAELYRAEGNLARAETVAREAVELSGKVFGPLEASADPNALTAAHTLGVILTREGKLDEAGPVLERVLNCWQKSYGTDHHPRVAVALANMADLRAQQQRYEEAETLSRRALAIRRELLGPEHPEIATNLNNLGHILRRRSDFAGAEAALQEAVRIGEKSMGPNHPELATFITNLGTLEAERGRLSAGETLLMRAVAIEEKNFGPADTRTLLAKVQLARVCQARGHMTEAEKLYREAAKSADPKVAQVARDYEMLLARPLKR